MMIPEKVAARLNEQVKNEMFASLTYLQMAFCFEDMGLKVFAKWFYKQSDEEKGHAMKISRYLLDQGATVKLQTMPEPKNKYASAEEIVQAALNHELNVTKQVHEIVDLARSEKDHATDNFIQWKVAEQVEEVNSVTELLNLVKQTQNLGQLLMLEGRIYRMVEGRE